MELAGGLEQREVEAAVGGEPGGDVAGLGRVDAVAGGERDSLQRVVVERGQGAPGGALTGIQAFR